MSTSRTDVRPGGTASWLSVWATRHPDQPCVIFQDDATTWGAFERAVNWLAASLRDSGVGQGDRVGCLMPNRTEYLMTFWATLRLGALFVPCNVRLTPPELAAVLDDFDPAVVVSDGSFQQTQASIDKLRPVRWLDVDTMTRDLASSAPRIEILGWPGTMPPRSSTRQAPPAGPRAPCSRTATSCTRACPGPLASA